MQSTRHDGTPPALHASTLPGHVLDVVILSSDGGLLATLREASSPEHAIWHAPSADAAVDYLVGGRCGILVADLGTLRGDAAGLLARLNAQFPELVLLAAGRRDEESAVAPLVSDGRIYRFLHKPISPARANLFLGAASRRYYEIRQTEPPMLTTMRTIARRPRVARAAIGILAVAALAVVGTVWFVASSTDPEHSARESARTAQRADQVAALLGQANIALATGRLLEPRGNNALELYREVLAIAPNDPEATAGIARVIAALEARVSAALAARDPQAGAVALTALQRAQPDHPRYTQFYDELIALSRSQAPAIATRAPALQTQRDRAVQSALTSSSSNEANDESMTAPTESAAPSVDEALEPALADTVESALEDDTIGESVEADSHAEAQPTSAEAEARDDALEQLALAVRLRERGSLIDPPENNAFERVLALHSQYAHFAEIGAERQRLAATLLEHARTLLTAGDLDQTRLYLDKVSQLEPDLASLRTLQAQLASARAERERNRVVPAASLKRTREVQPEYPYDAQTRRIEGWVDVEFTIATDGTTREHIVHDAEPPGVFDRSALEALRRWRFEPIVRGGQAVEQRATVRLQYRLEE